MTLKKEPFQKDLAHRPVRIWLFSCMVMVALMVFIGGVTRLTESGLSIVEWKLVTGIFPPLTQQGWEAELEAYRATPEYQQINRGMNVAEFKQIYWLEWLHRLLGRLTGLIFILPLIGFTFSKWLSRGFSRQMALACLLVTAQGTLGWLMVYSGLQQDPRVSPLRLAAHLSLAFGLFSYLYWIWLQHQAVPRQANARGWQPLLIRGVTGFIAVQIILGAFVAGTDAGLVYNSWPLMDGQWIPPVLLPLEPWYRNLLETIAMVQWQHRSFAYVVALGVGGFIAISWRNCDNKALLSIFGGILVLQFLLGVLTIIHVVPLWLASAHQMVALALLACAVRLCYNYPIGYAKPSRPGLQSARPRGIV